LEQNFSIFLSAFQARKFSRVASDRGAEFRNNRSRAARAFEPKIAALLKGARVS
jgi:hypothetical protein